MMLVMVIFWNSLNSVNKVNGVFSQVGGGITGYHTIWYAVHGSQYQYYHTNSAISNCMCQIVRICHKLKRHSEQKVYQVLA